MLGVMGRRGYRFGPDWELTRDDINPDVVCDFATVTDDYYVDEDFASGPEREFDISFQLKLKGYDLKVAGDNMERPEPNVDTNKLLWKWGPQFDLEFRLRSGNYLKGLIFDNRLAVDTPLNVADGYGNVGVNFIEELRVWGVDVSSSLNWKIQNRLDLVPKHVLTVADRGFGNMTFGVRLSQPDSAGDCPSTYKINWSMWEFPKMPEHWVPGANSVDLCFVPCGWNKQLWLEGGVKTPVVVVPLGFNTRHFWPGSKDKKIFRFYTDGSILGGNNLIDQWKASLLDREDLELVVKFPYPVEAKSTRNIRVIGEKVSVNVMRELFWASDCYLYPTQAEGFGLFPLEAMACGLPVLATRLETMYSFINPDIAFPTPVKSVDWFHQPDMDYFFDLVLKIADGKWDFLGDKGQRAAEHVHTHWTWKNTVEKVVRVLNGK